MLHKKHGAGGRGKPGVAGAATERPLERVAEDPTGVGYTKDAHSMSGRDYKGGAGAEARGRLSPPNNYFACPSHTKDNGTLKTRLIQHIIKPFGVHALGS